MTLERQKYFRRWCKRLESKLWLLVTWKINVQSSWLEWNSSVTHAGGRHNKIGVMCIIVWCWLRPAPAALATGRRPRLGGLLSVTAAQSSNVKHIYISVLTGWQCWHLLLFCLIFFNIKWTNTLHSVCSATYITANATYRVPPIHVCSFHTAASSTSQAWSCHSYSSPKCSRLPVEKKTK